MRRDVYVTRPIPEAGLAILRREVGGFDLNEEDRVLSPGELKEQVRGRKAVVCLLTDTIDGEVMDAAEGCRVFANMAVGFDNVDVPAATARGICVTNTPGVLTDATSDFAWALLFSTARRVVEADAYSRAGKYKAWGPLSFLGGDITGRTLGIVGAGRIGAAVALKSKGFRMQVLYTDAYPNDTLEREVGARRVELPELLAESDFVSLHVPLLPETHHLIGAAELKAMKRSAYLVNTSRGPVIDEAALAEALRTGEIAGAGLDVYEEEPVMHPGLLGLPNVVLAPHIASATIDTRSRMSSLAAEAVVQVLGGNKPVNLVNPEVWKG